MESKSKGSEGTAAERAAADHGLAGVSPLCWSVEAIFPSRTFKLKNLQFNIDAIVVVHWQSYNDEWTMRHDAENWQMALNEIEKAGKERA